MSFPCVFYKGIYYVLLLVVVWPDVGWLQCLLPVLRKVAFSPSSLSWCRVLGRVNAHDQAVRVHLSASGQVNGCKLDFYDIRVKKLGFPSSELLIWPHRRPPHWDYLVICSPNFYEVAFPCVFFVVFCFTMLYIVTFLGDEAYLVKGLIGCMSFPL